MFRTRRRVAFWKASALVLLTFLLSDVGLYLCLPHVLKGDFAGENLVEARQRLRIGIERLRASDPMLTKQGNEYTIGIFGGSLAYLLAERMKERNAQDPLPETQDVERRMGKKVRFLNLAMLGGREPVQFNRLHSFHDRIDLAIFVDGFNEMFECALPEGLRGCEDMEARWNQSSHDLQTEDVHRQVAQLTQRLQKLADSWIWPPLRFSGLFKLYLYWLNVHTLEQAVSLEGMTTLAPRDGQHGLVFEHAEGLNDSDEDRVRSWSGCLTRSHRFAASMGLPIFFFLQPNQYVKNSKPFTAQEERDAFLKEPELSTVADGVYARLDQIYDRFQRETDRLRSQGLPVYSLTGVFRGAHETLYTDNCCHVNAAGSDIMTAEILRRVLETLH